MITNKFVLKSYRGFVQSSGAGRRNPNEIGAHDWRHGRPGTTATRRRAREGTHPREIELPPASVDPGASWLAVARALTTPKPRGRLAGRYGRRYVRRWMLATGRIEHTGPVAGCTTAQCWHRLPHATPLLSPEALRKVGRKR